MNNNKHIFHGGCHKCCSQELHGIQRCAGCQYKQAEWGLPDLSIKENPQPKFKVGDRVKIDWGLGVSIRFENGKIEELAKRKNELDKKIDCYIVRTDSGDGYRFDEKDLTLVESKPKCKFKELDDIEMTDAWMKRYKTDGNFTKHGIITSIDDCIHIREIKTDGWRFTCCFDDANEYLKYPEKKKEKWSVGTYVEFLEDVGVFQKGFYEITTVNMSLPYFVLDSCLNLYCNDADDYVRHGYLKWHGNNPENKVSILPNQGEKIEDVVSRIRQHGLLWSDYSSETIAYKGVTAGKEIEVELENQIKPIVKRKGDFKGYMEATREYGYDPLFHPDKYFTIDILQKPEITISKQKRIEININKPKI